MASSATDAGILCHILQYVGMRVTAPATSSRDPSNRDREKDDFDRESGKAR
jgi:hypothetical protein